MANYHGVKGRAWTQAEIDQMLAWTQEGVLQSEIAQRLGRTLSSVEGKHRLVRLAQIHGPSIPGQARYSTPKYRENDDLGHCLAVVRANGGKSFPWWPTAIIDAFNAKERAPADQIVRVVG